MDASAAGGVSRAVGPDRQHELRRPFSCDGGRAVIADVPDALLRAHGPLQWDDRSFLLLEDGVPLPYPTKAHDEIRRNGRGRYSPWGQAIHFSSSDGSDPRTNGRAYAVAYEAPAVAAVARLRPHLRLGFLGNINNVGFLLAEAARDLGFQAELYLVDEGLLHDPASKEAGFASKAPAWIHDFRHLADLDFGALSAAALELARDASDRADFLFLNGPAASLAREIDRPYAFCSTGSDITFYASFGALSALTSGWSPDFRAGRRGRDELMSFADGIVRQRDAILGARALATGHPRGLYPELDEVLEDIGFDESRRSIRRLVDPRRSKPRAPRGFAEGLQIFSLARVDFTPRPGFSSMDRKGTDRLLEGFAIFLKRGGRGRLHMTAKGHDTASARVLATELGIEAAVEWLPEVPFDRYLDLIDRADVVCDAVSRAGPGGVCHDALAAGRPVLGDLRPDVFAPLYGGDGYPGFHVTSAEEIADALQRASGSPDLLESLRQRGFEFVERTLSPHRFMGEFLSRWVHQLDTERACG